MWVKIVDMFIATSRALPMHVVTTGIPSIDDTLSFTDVFDGMLYSPMRAGAFGTKTMKLLF